MYHAVRQYFSFIHELRKGIFVIVGVPRESYPGERRVALTPAVVPNLAKAGLEVVIQSGAGEAAGYPDTAYSDKGAKILPDRAAVFSSAEVILQVLAHGANDLTGSEDVPLYRRDQVLVGFLRPFGSQQVVQQIADAGVTSFSVELMPRITRAQSMDALSSMANIAGYKAVLMAADAVPRVFPMMTTAAGTITPARVLIIGVGVAGLQAIATARRLGAVVSAYDVRPAVKEQVQSLGAKFVELPLETKDAQDERGYAKAQDEAFYQKQRELLGKVVAESDVVITTAVVPGKKAPLLVPGAMVQGMQPGSVIVDLAAERGGNCELTKAGQTIQVNGVTIVGYFNIASGVPFHASQMYAKNLLTFLQSQTKEGKFLFDMNDQVTTDTLLTRSGQIVNKRIREHFGMTPLA